MVLWCSLVLVVVCCGFGVNLNWFWGGSQVVVSYDFLVFFYRNHVLGFRSCFYIYRYNSSWLIDYFIHDCKLFIWLYTVTLIFRGFIMIFDRIVLIIHGFEHD